MESKWPQRTCREAVIDTFVQEKFKPPVKSKRMMILLIRFVQYTDILISPKIN